MNARLRSVLQATVGGIPVRVQAGPAKGARWTLFPWTSYWRGTHEPAFHQAIEQLGGGDIRGWSCWDLGAHYGLYSVALAMRVGPTGQVAAFEPNPESFRKLEGHARMNRLGWLKPYPCAASDRAGSGKLFTYGDLGSTSTHLRYENETETEAAAPIPIRTVRIDDLVDAGELRPPQFIKVDVEGHGHRALEGMRRSLAAARPTLIVGFHSQEEVDGVLAILDPLGYRRRPVCPPAGEGLIGGDFLFYP